MLLPLELADVTQVSEETHEDKPKKVFLEKSPSLSGIEETTEVEEVAQAVTLAIKHQHQEHLYCGQPVDTTCHLWSGMAAHSCRHSMRS